jgi:hypothetical protein
VQFLASYLYQITAFDVRVWAAAAESRLNDGCRGPGGVSGLVGGVRCGRAAALAGLEARGVVTRAATGGISAFSPIRLRGESVASTVVKDREDRF